MPAGSWLAFARCIRVSRRKFLQHFFVRLNYVSLHCSGMTDRSQKLIELQDGDSVDPTAQTCVELQGCGSLMTSTVVPAEIAAPVTQIPRRKWAAIKLETHYGAVCVWNYNAELAWVLARSAFIHTRWSVTADKNNPDVQNKMGRLLFNHSYWLDITSEKRTNCCQGSHTRVLLTRACVCVWARESEREKGGGVHLDTRWLISRSIFVLIDRKWITEDQTVI